MTALRRLSYSIALKSAVSCPLMLCCVVSCHSGKMPTVVSPELYRARFCEAMDKYFLMVPDHWTGLGINCWAVHACPSAVIQKHRGAPSQTFYAQTSVSWTEASVWGSCSTDLRPTSTLDVVNVWTWCRLKPECSVTAQYHSTGAALLCDCTVIKTSVFITGDSLQHNQSITDPSLDLFHRGFVILLVPWVQLFQEDRWKLSFLCF